MGRWGGGRCAFGYVAHFQADVVAVGVQSEKAVGCLVDWGSYEPNAVLLAPWEIERVEVGKR